VNIFARGRTKLEILCASIQFDGNLFQRTIGPVSLNSTSEQCGMWSKCLRTFNWESICVSGH